MTDPTITCPSCRAEIKLTESLAAPLLESTKRQYEQLLTEKESSIAGREAAIKEQREAIDEQVREKLKKERATIVADESRKARLLLAGDLEQKTKELTDLQEVLQQRDQKLAAAQQAQAELLRKQRELDDAKREMELTIEKRVQESLVAVRGQAKQEAEESLKLQVAEREQTILAMQRQIEELKRRAEQGSQQLQGEVQELELEALLRDKFPGDGIEGVPKGEHGGDVLHRVLGSAQQLCGTILWESKRTKNWSDAWLVKLRADQRAAKAEFAVLVSQALPKGIVMFDFVDGIWVTAPLTLVPVGVALRHALMELALARQAAEGQQTKMELVYQYLTGPRFKQRVQAIVEKFTDMQQDLEKERKTMTRLWAKRQEQLRCVLDSTAGMYGDLQGIAGRTFQEIDGLEVRVLEGPDETVEAE